MLAQPRTTLLLARHGQSTWNAEQRWQGQADPPLSDHGRQQARLAARRVGDVDLIVSSPQQRALETATIIGGDIGVGPVVVSHDLRERNAGEWSGLTRVEIDEQFPGWLGDERWPQGWESDSALLGRVDPALRAVVAEYSGGTILVLCHGGVIRAVEMGLGLEVGRVPNLSGRVLHLDGSDPLGSTEPAWVVGEHVQLLDEELASGGDGQRV